MALPLAYAKLAAARDAYDRELRQHVSQDPTNWKVPLCTKGTRGYKVALEGLRGGQNPRMRGILGV